MGENCVNEESVVTSDSKAEGRPYHQEVVVGTMGDVIPENAVEDPRCPSRDYVSACTGKYLDLNKNGKLERSELQAAIDSLPWYGRGILNILGSVDKMMKKCDVDGDDAISMDYDMKMNKDTCLASCFKRLAYKKAFFPDCKP